MYYFTRRFYTTTVKNSPKTNNSCFALCVTVHEGFEIPVHVRGADNYFVFNSDLYAKKGAKFYELYSLITGNWVESLETFREKLPVGIPLKKIQQWEEKLVALDDSQNLFSGKQYILSNVLDFQVYPEIGMVFMKQDEANETSIHLYGEIIHFIVSVPSVNARFGRAPYVLWENGVFDLVNRRTILAGTKIDSAKPVVVATSVLEELRGLRADIHELHNKRERLAKELKETEDLLKPKMDLWNEIEVVTRKVLGMCFICQEREPDSCLNCGHQFCEECIEKLGEDATCPFCRGKIESYRKLLPSTFD